MNEKQEQIREALNLLGVKRLILAIHDQSFPSLQSEEIGRGSPYSLGAHEFLQFISSLGFTGVQLGPQGKTTRVNPSPYDGTIFSKSELSISLQALANDGEWCGILPASTVQQLVKDAPKPASRFRDRSQYTYAWDAVHRALEEAFGNFVDRREELKPLWLSFMMWVQDNAYWLDSDALYEALVEDYGNDDWRKWRELDRDLLVGERSQEKEERIKELRGKYARTIEFYRFCQFVLYKQHKTFRERAHQLGLKLFADLQIGFAPRDVWALRDLFLKDYLLGAPPSRTNPDGQPWGYPVLNPALYFAEDGKAAGPVLEWMNRRIGKILTDFDGVRIDHPHGLVCPWVYRSDLPDALQAVQQGARLFSSPDVPDHPQLAQFSIVGPEQLDRQHPKYGDRHVEELSPEQVDRYAVIVDAIKQRLSQAGMDGSDIVCEVLSSSPNPLKAVLSKNGLGRFRVTQKADPTHVDDVYRSDRAMLDDWIMVGTHDTPPLWQVVQNWTDKQREDWAQYLSDRLEPEPEQRPALKEKLARCTADLCEAMFADLFAGPAQNVSVFFADLLGIAQTYNRPGLVSEDNWVLSIPPDYRKQYAKRIQEKQALNVPAVLAAALHARKGTVPRARKLIDALRERNYLSCEKSSVEK